MEALDQYYIDKLNEIAEEVQASEELAKYLEEEEESDYKLMQEMFEPKIGAIYESVSAYYPLQLIALEKYLLDERFEGLYLPKVIGFTVLRGEINDRYKYILPQDHFKEILCLYANFWELDKDYMAHLNGVFNKVRTEIPNFSEKFLTYLMFLQNSPLDVDATAENRVSAIVSRDIQDELTEYYNLVETIHTKGYLEEATIEEVHTFYNAHEGRSLINECVRKVIYGYYTRLITNLEERDYNEYSLTKMWRILAWFISRNY